MKIVAVLGSPRLNGNSATLARKFLDAARALGAEAEEHVLNRLAYDGCQGCGVCKTKQDRCAVEDGLTPIYDAIRAADILLLASPVYFADISGQLKCFFDRTYAYLNPNFTSRLPAGKKSVFVLTQGNADPETFKDIHPRYEQWLKLYGFERNYLLRAVGVSQEGEVNNQPLVMQQAEELARKLVF